MIKINLYFNLKGKCPVHLVFHILCAAFSLVNILWRDSHSHGLMSGRRDHGREHQIFLGGGCTQWYCLQTACNINDIAFSVVQTIDVCIQQRIMTV